MSGQPRGRLFGGAALLVVGLALAAGLHQVGSPGQQRERRLDERRVADLRVLEEAINAFWRDHDRLPSSLEELAGAARPGITVRDPVTGAVYDYTVGGETGYALCAEFQTEGPDPAPGRREAWAHAAGRQCFELTAGARRR